jgi:hypothetical protein
MSLKVFVLSRLQRVLHRPVDTTGIFGNWPNKGRRRAARSPLFESRRILGSSLFFAQFIPVVKVFPARP